VKVLISPPKKILAIKLRALGDTVLMTAALKELKRAYPAAEIDVVVTQTWAPLLEGNPNISRIWKYERYNDAPSRAKAIARLALRLRREKYDAVVNFHASPSSATLAFAMGAKVRSIHFHGHRDKNRYSTVVVPGKGVLKPIIERDMDTVRALGVHVPAGRLPEIPLSNDEHEKAKRWIAENGLTAPLLIMSLGASRPAKAWPIDRFAALAIEWIREKSGSVLAIAGPDETRELFLFQKAVEDLGADAETRAKIRAENSFGLRELAGLLSQAAVYAGNDSGPKHIAIAVGAPTVTVFGPEHPFEWHPYSTIRHPYLFIEPLSCRKDADPGMPSWCGVHDCITEQHRCMTGIPVSAVLTECLRVAQ
jgi:ADP-heptose:LPS heptosyltransferase